MYFFVVVALFFLLSHYFYLPVCLHKFLYFQMAAYLDKTRVKILNRNSSIPDEKPARQTHSSDTWPRLEAEHAGLPGTSHSR
jgi:hypothetical protein